jgi:hypothetical protein
MAFQNNPNVKTENNEGMVKRYVHQPLHIDHYGIHAQIKENGKVVISSVASQSGEEVEYDEVEIPASLVFKLANLLKATRTIKFVPVGEAKDLAPVTRDE